MLSFNVIELFFGFVEIATCICTLCSEPGFAFLCVGTFSVCFCFSVRVIGTVGKDGSK